MVAGMGFTIFLYTTKTRLFKDIENFATKNKKTSDKKILICSYSCSKHLLWVLVRTACEAVLTSTLNLCFEQNKKNNVYPCKPKFYYIKVGFKGGGSKLYGRVFVMICSICIAGV